MTTRRSLTASLDVENPQAAADFIRDGSSKKPPERLIPLTVRIPPTLARALRRAAADRSIDRQAPYTQQAIATAALESWLIAQGYLTDG